VPGEVFFSFAKALASLLARVRVF